MRIRYFAMWPPWPGSGSDTSSTNEPGPNRQPIATSPRLSSRGVGGAGCQPVVVGGWARPGRAGAPGGPAPRDACRAPFGFGLDRSQGGGDCLFPAPRNQLTPALSQEPQVGPDLPIVGQPRAGTTGMLGEHERLHDVRDRPADQPEVDPLGRGGTDPPPRPG